MNIIQLYQDFGIPYKTEGHKHTHAGYAHTECPFCTGNPGLHLGYNLEEDYFICWRCGWKPPVKALSEILHLTPKEVYPIIKMYGVLSLSKKDSKHRAVKKSRFKIPTGVEPLSRNHRKYLEGRNFDPDYLIKAWGIQGTGPISKLDKISYKHRIFIPFMWNGEIVSFDSRDITGKSKFKYMACPVEREAIPHKSILYGNQEKWKETGICVEGPTDVWRLGPRAFATSGIKFTPKQITVIKNSFKRVAICFDGGELQAQKQARNLQANLKFRGVDAFIVKIVGDPGAMSQDDANHLVKSLI